MMDSPVRKTQDKDKHNIRKEFRGNLLREVWDEIDENGNIVKTAVWDITDRWGKPIGEQSWDEYEKYLDDQILQKQMQEAEQEYRKSPEYLDERKKRAQEHKYLRSFGKRDKLLKIINDYLSDNPESQPMIPAYKFRNKLLPYAKNDTITTSQMVIIMKSHIKNFERIGLTFGTGWSLASRNICTYIGYNSHEIAEDVPRKKNKYDEIAKAIEKLPRGEYSEKYVVDFIHSNYDKIMKHNLLGLLIRNSYRWNLSYNNGTFKKE